MVEPEDIKPLLRCAVRRPDNLMLIEPCRQYLAAARFGRRQKLEIAESASAGVMPGTITHNRQETEKGLFGSSHRTQRLLGPLSALDPVYDDADKLKVLSIGPRTEMELLHLMGLGFKAENIRGIDLISSSPMIDVGDMHALPYPDKTFDVVISGWVLTYSSNPGQAIKEMCRVCKPGGLIAIGTTYDPFYGEGYVAGTKDDPENIQGSMFLSFSEFIHHINTEFVTIFTAAPLSEDHKGPVMFIARLV